MEKVIMLGTGCGKAIELYNTCFVIQNEQGDFLVDAGGSIEIEKRLKIANVDIGKLSHIFISHSHTDHIFGLIWLYRRIAGMVINGRPKEKVNIYCNKQVYEAIIGISKLVLPIELLNALDKVIEYVVLKDGDVHKINDLEYTFFDTHAKGEMLYGFETVLSDGKRLVFLGDETCDESQYARIKNADYVMHEAFCLDSEEGIPKIVKEHHATVKKVCEAMEPLNIKNLILFHTEESHENRKELYEKEAKQYFSNNVIVPNDLEIIEIK